MLDSLIAEKTRLIMDTNIALASGSDLATVRPILERVAALEAEIANHLISGGRNAEAAIHLISAAACLTDIGATATAIQAYEAARECADTKKLKRWITRKIREIRVA